MIIASNVIEYFAEYKRPSFRCLNTTGLNTNFFFNLCGGTMGIAATTGLLYQSQMIGEGDCAEIGGMKIGRGN
jgi:hypothetical protein